MLFALATLHTSTSSSLPKCLAPIGLFAALLALISNVATVESKEDYNLGDETIFTREDYSDQAHEDHEDRAEARLSIGSLASSSAASSSSSPLAIVAPKRSDLVASLNQQFKLGGQQASGETTTNKSSPATSGGLFGANLAWLSSCQQQQKSQQQRPKLHVDRSQQQSLAPKPSLLNPAGSTRSSDPAAAAAAAAANGANNANNQQQPLQQQQSQQLYRGYSLIELEVRSDSDRRYVQELYANLSAAVNEQAQNPNSPTVSPYVDVDFWSFKSALNDQIDIMVSPKSRSFILNQLGRAKIRHQIKIDDIQARLDAQQQQLAAGGAGGLASGLAQPQSSSGTSNRQAGAPGGDQSGLSGRHGAEPKTGPAQAQGQPKAGAAVSGAINGRQALFGTESSGPAARTLNETLFFDNYQRLADINQHLETIVEKNRDVARVKVIGRSSQGRYLRVLKLGYDQRDIDGATTLSGSHSQQAQQSAQQQQPLPVSVTNLNNATNILDAFIRRLESTQKLGSIWLDGGTHAREWISPATVMYIATQLADNHAKCVKFVETMKFLVSQQQQQKRLRRFAVAPTLDANLLTGINEINSSLLGKPTQLGRQRTEMERTLEMLAKSPQEVASEHNCNLPMEQLLRRYTFYMMPVLNPDGYEYSHTHNRLWRKTRSTSNHPIYRHFCLGADPNRNYDARHGQTGSSSHPCSQTYAGSVPFTEPETKHQSNFVYANRIGMKMYISFHSYSQMILLPFSHSQHIAPDHKDLESVGQAGVKAIEQTHGTVYRVGPSASVLYTASGTASDWAYEKAGIKYSYTIELRDTGTYGFLLPRQQIIPTGEETFNGLIAMIGQMEKNDNLLTSKSSQQSALLSPAAQQQQLHSSLSSSSSATVGVAQSNRAQAHTIPDYNHVPAELDHLKPFAKQRLSTRPPLESLQLEGVANFQGDYNGGSNFLDSSGASSSSSSPTAPGARDRVRAGAEFGPNHRLDEEPNPEDNEPDAGYAFEGEGDLMEPNGENSVELTSNFEAQPSSSLVAAHRIAGRQDHSRRIAQFSGLTSGRRNIINSPLQTTTSPLERIAVQARESSHSLATGDYLSLSARADDPSRLAGKQSLAS